MNPMQREMFNEGLADMNGLIYVRTRQMTRPESVEYFANQLKQIRESSEFQGYDYEDLGRIVSLKRFLFSRRTKI